MENRAFRVLAALLLCCVYAAPAISEPLRVLYAEPFQTQTVSRPGAQKAGPSNLRVQAFGRTFELQLEDNTRLLRAASAQTREGIGAIQLLKGTVKDVPGSWVRLTLSGGRYSGAFWDGAELYAIAPRETLDTALLAPMQPAVTAIYRLSDTQGGLLQGTCGTNDPGERANGSPLAKFKALINELRAAADSTFAATPREIEISLLADFELTSRLGSGTVRNLLEKANIVDGIFSSQVGVSTIPTDFIAFATDTDPFTSTDASSLLNELGDYRSSSPLQRSRGLTHLVTGRQLDGSTIGIAFRGSLCEAQAGVSLSESSTFIDSALVMAHELGHNFGAPHDAEAGSSCAATPVGFLMAPQFNNSQTFSACSLQQMQPHIAAASCIVPSRNRDLAVSAAGPIQAIVDEPFELPIDLRSIGDTAAVNIVLTVHLPLFGVTVSSMSMPGATCTNESDTIRCEMPTLAAGSSTRLSVRASYASASQVGFGVDVISSNDVNSGNNHASVVVDVAAQHALRVTTVSAPANVTRGDPFDVEFDVASIGNQTLNDLDVQLFMFNARTITASIDGGTCVLGPGNNVIAICNLDSIAPGTSRRLRAHVVSDRVGEEFISAQASERNGPAHAFTDFKIRTRPAHDIELWTDQEDRQTAIGVDAVWQLEVRSVGAYAVDNVHVRVDLWASTNAALEGPLAALCTRISQDVVDCDLGTMAAGAVVAGQLRVRSDVSTNFSFQVRVAPGFVDDDSFNDGFLLDLTVRPPTDAVLSAASTQNLFEQLPATLQATIAGVGTNAIEDLFVETFLPAQFAISSATLGQGSCGIHPQNSITCGRSLLPPGESTQLTIQYQAAVPGVYTGSIKVSARVDTDQSNNTQALTFQVAPAVNGSLQGPPSAVLPTGVEHQVAYTLRTNRYALTDARLDFTGLGALDEFVASAPGAVCSASGTGHSCSFGTIPANSVIPVTVRLRNTNPTVVSINALLVSPAEATPADNAATVSYTFVQAGDFAVSARQTVINATVGQRVQVSFDMNALATVLDGYLEITYEPIRLDAPTTQTVSSCIWQQQPVRCVVGSSVAPGTYAENFSFVPRSAGPLQITLRVGGRNDFNAANDAVSVTVNVVEPGAPPPSSGGGGGGGGGSMSWLFAALLLLMWHHRRTRLHR